jgi:secondary thiamine-phosphate synthase enzyme
METFSVQTESRSQFVDITDRVSSCVKQSGIEKGICSVYVPHTTSAVTINENADPSVKADIQMEMDKVIPLRDNYSHAEGNSAAHIKSSLIGESVCVPISEGKLALGTWQGIFFCEFDGPRTRRVNVLVK